jgi:exosortase A-associated hydrolase 2
MAERVMVDAATAEPSQGLTEQPFFFENGQYRLFGLLHKPVAGGLRNEGFVLCHPAFEEKLWAHRVYVGLARELARHGCPVLRFDYMGYGDSDGDFEQATVATHLSDIAKAVEVLKTQAGVSSVGLLGLRFGATLAALSADAVPGISHLVLWDPLVDGAAYMQEVLLSNLATQSAVHQKILHTREELVAQMQAGGTVNIEGYGLNQAFYDGVSTIKLQPPRTYAGPCLIAQIGRDNQKPKKNLETLRAGYAAGELVLCTEDPFWKEIKPYCPRADNLVRATTDWLKKA